MAPCASAKRIQPTKMVENAPLNPAIRERIEFDVPCGIKAVKRFDQSHSPRAFQIVAVRLGNKHGLHPPHNVPNQRGMQRQNFFTGRKDP